MKISVLPQDDNTNGWSKIAKPRDPGPNLTDEVKADWVVLGAGYAGLAAARRLAENRPDEKVILVEAGEVGENASGRNSGFAIDLPHNVGSSLDELEGSHAYMRLSRAAIASLEEQVKKYNIECDWSVRGKYHAAVSPRFTEEVLVPFAKEMEQLGEPNRWLDHDQLTAEIGTPYYNAAVFTPGGVLMNPAALTKGLADALPENVSLYENSPVTEMDLSNGVHLTTPQGKITAPRMILTNNGFAQKFGFFKGRFVIIAAHASLSRCLTPDERQALGGVDDWGLTPANALAGTTMRFTQDHRILIRQHMDYSPSFRCSDARRAVIREGHQKVFEGRFPMLPNVTMEHTWTGFVCLSQNNAPGFGALASNIWTAVCQNAVGVTKGTIGGMLAADMACGVDNPLIADMQGLGSPNSLPPEPFLGVGARARLFWEVWKARAEK